VPGGSARLPGTPPSIRFYGMTLHTEPDGSYDTTVHNLRVFRRKPIGPDSVKNPLIVECLKPNCYWRVSAGSIPYQAFLTGLAHIESSRCPFDPLRRKQTS
jgi:hypothetical protein